MKEINIIRGDITKMDTDAIVNAANTSLMGGGGVDGAIHRVAGPKLAQACKELHGCTTGDAKITPGFNLKAKYVIHTPGPVWQGGKKHEAELLENSYHNSLAVAEENGCRTVAFPSISTGIYHFPLEKATIIALETINAFLAQSKVVEGVTMVCFDNFTFQAYGNTMQMMKFDDQVFTEFAN